MPSVKLNTASDIIYILCESAQQARWATQHRDNFSSGEICIVAINGDASWYLELHKIPYLSIEDYQHDKTANEIETLLASQIGWAQQVDNFLQHCIPAFKTACFRPTRTYLYYLKNTWDTFIHRASLINELAAQTQKPFRIFYFANAVTATYDQTLVLNGSALAKVMVDWETAAPGKTGILSSLPNDQFWKRQDDRGRTVRQVVTRLLPKPLRRFLKEICDSLKSNAQPTDLSSKNNQQHLSLIIQQHYDLTPEVWAELKRRGTTLYRFDDVLSESHDMASPLSLEFELKSAWDAVLKNPHFLRPPGCGTARLDDSLQSLFEKFWFDVIPALWQSRTGALAVLKRHRPNGIVLGVTSGAEQLGFLMAARETDIPVVSYLHGAIGHDEHAGYDNENGCWSDYILVYGQGQVDYIRSRPPHGEIAAIPIPVGSARLDLVQRQGQSRRTEAHSSLIALYVPGGWFTNFFRYDFHTYQTAPVLRIRKRIAELFNKYPEITFLYKANVSEGNDPSLNMFRLLCPKVKIIDSIPLTELQWSVDLIIHEIPSTGMYESLVTDKPIVLFANSKVYRMTAEAKTLLRQRVSLAETEEEFIKILLQTLQSKSFDVVKNADVGFSKKYATYLNDGQSAQRAANAICEIVSAKADTSWP